MFLASSIVVPTLAGAACAVAAWRRLGRERLAWALMAFSCVSWGALSAASALLGTSPLMTSLIDVRFGATVVATILGMALLASSPAPATARLQALLDAAIVASSLLFISWGTVLAPAYRNISIALDVRLINLLHPLGDLVMATTLVFMLYRAWRARRLSWLYLAVGVLVNAITDSGSTWIQLRSIDSTLGDLLGWGWLAGFALIGLGAVFEKRNQPIRSIVRLPIAATAFLNVPPVAVGIVAAIRELTTGELEPFLFWNGLVVVALVLTRELATVVENRALIHTMERRIAERTYELSNSEAKLRTLLKTSPDAIILTDAEGAITYLNSVFERVLGRAPGAVMGRSWLDLIHPDDQPRLQWVIEKARQTSGGRASTEARISHADHGWRQAEVTITNLLEDGTVKGLVVNLRDITERKALDDQLAHHALHDPLTGLVTRAVFRDRLHQSVVRAARRRERPAVLMVNLDGFRRINDGLGYTVGDGVLVAAAERLRQSVRAGDTVARMSGDTFAILVEDTEKDESPDQVAERVLNELKGISIANRPIELSASIGIASLAPGDHNPDDPLRDADTALFEAKAAGDGHIAVYDGSRMHAATRSRLELQAELQRAIEHKEFVGHYQPIVRLKDGRPVAMEALVRWVHPWRGMLPPGDFIFAADKTGAIVSLGRWMLLEAARQVRRWQDELHLATLGLAVNLSVRQLNDDGLAEDISLVLKETGLEPSLLMLEMTESALMEDFNQSVERLQRLKNLGLNLAIDDFRSGYPSLTHLRHLPIDTLKIDRSFVLNLGKPQETAQVRSILSLAESLGAEVVAEGVEDALQTGALVEMGCRLGQGFYFSKPLAAAQAFDYLERQCRQKAA
ncbi:MAG TPA: EAL domain-containing protein [Candidatus Acidoferrum sp.]|nr:EAL domain-containing protein [Candidatus Acidoferrum sp.]